MRPLVLSRPPTSNLAFYRERGAQPAEDYIWVEVLTDSLVKVNDRWRARAVPIFHLTIYRSHNGEIGRVRYAPTKRPASDPLPARTVNKLVREAIA